MSGGGAGAVGLSSLVSATDQNALSTGCWGWRSLADGCGGDKASLCLAGIEPIYDPTPDKTSNLSCLNLLEKK